MSQPPLPPGLATLLLRPARWLPVPLQSMVAEQVLNLALATPLRDGLFEPLEGRWLSVVVEDLGLSWSVTARGPCLRVADHWVPADAWIRGNWREFLLVAARREDPDTLFFQRRLVVEGDTELGHAVKNLMDGIDFDELPPSLVRLLEKGGGLAGL